MSQLGKVLYTSRSFWIFKIFYLVLALLLLISQYWQTFTDPTFIKHFAPNFSGVVSFHIKYPEELLIYIFTLFIPAIYYAFFRSLRFCENAIIMNRGLPFFNRILYYKDIDSFKVIHPKYLMGVKRADCKEEFIFTIKDHDRAIAIFDQHNIGGDLGDQSYKSTITTGKKLLMFFVCFCALMFIVQYLGIVRYLVR